MQCRHLTQEKDIIYDQEGIQFMKTKYFDKMHVVAKSLRKGPRIAGLLEI